MRYNNSEMSPFYQKQKMEKKAERKEAKCERRRKRRKKRHRFVYFSYCGVHIARPTIIICLVSSTTLRLRLITFLSPCSQQFFSFFLGLVKFCAVVLCHIVYMYVCQRKRVCCWWVSMYNMLIEEAPLLMKRSLQKCTSKTYLTFPSYIIFCALSFSPIFFLSFFCFSFRKEFRSKRNRNESNQKSV